MDVANKMDVDISLPVPLSDTENKNEYTPCPSQQKPNCDAETVVYGQLIVLGYVLYEFILCAN